MLSDIKRTRGLESRQRDMLANILLTYCARSADRSEGRKAYVQGMHMLVACPMWAGLSEEEATSRPWYDTLHRYTAILMQRYRTALL